MENISGNLLTVNLIASVTFPVALYLSEWADDVDPFDLPSLQIADTAMGLNGDLITWTKANPIKITLAAIPGSFTDINLGILLEANRAGRGKTSARDVIQLIGVYPNRLPITLINGVITDGIPGNSVASAGRLKSKTYTFAFENKAGF